jgi:peptidoglycan/LPS O-acetylase OafA/YrhL
MNPIVEAFRGAAALLVLAHHYSYQLDPYLTFGHLHVLHHGVDLFFVITGFLFAPHLLGEVRQHPFAFAIRRVFRIYPLYLVVLLAYFLRGLPYEGNALAFVKHLTFSQTLPLFDLASASFYSQVFWTLPVEVGFYAIVAVGLWCAAQPLCSNSRLVTFGLIASIGFGLSYGLNPDQQSEQWLLWQAQTPALLLQFWFGMVVYRSQHWMQMQRSRRLAAAALGLFLLASLAFVYPSAIDGALTARPFGPFNIVSGLAYALLLAAMQGCELRGTMASVALRAGALSYAIYLFHEMTLKLTLKLVPSLPPLIQVLLATALVVCLAQVLNRWIEAPMREWGRRLALRHDSALPAHSGRRS